MFDIGMTEIMVIAVVAIIVVGPKDLPGLLRTGAKYVAQIRGMARDFQSQINSAISETELKESLKDVGSINPLSDVKSEIDDYMDSARSFDEPDDDYIAEGDKLASTKAEAIDGDVSDMPDTDKATETVVAEKSDAKTVENSTS